MRVLEWIIRRCDDEVDAAKTPIGYIPNINDINIEGIEDEVSVETLKELLSIDTGLWKEDAAGIEEYYNKIGGRMPKELLDQLDALKSRLG
jgi:phosphoenolpyruvate carboxykinase (GTP)